MPFGRLRDFITGGRAAAGDPVVEPAGEPARDPGPSPDEIEDAQTAAALDALRDEVRAAGRDLPPVVTSMLRQIDDRLREVVRTVAAQGASTEQRVLLAAMVGDYLPTPLRAYLALDDGDRTDSSSATAQLAAQLGLLEETVRDLGNQVRIGAIAELSTHGRFLADKFAGPDAGLVLGRSD